MDEEVRVHCVTDEEVNNWELSVMRTMHILTEDRSHENDAD